MPSKMFCFAVCNSRRHALPGLCFCSIHLRLYQNASELGLVMPLLVPILIARKGGMYLSDHSVRPLSGANADRQSGLYSHHREDGAPSSVKKEIAVIVYPAHVKVALAHVKFIHYSTIS